MDVPCVEVLLEGPKSVAKAFVIAFLRGRGGEGMVVDLEQEDFDCETFRERLEDFLRPDHNVSHLLVAAEDAPAVRDAVREAGKAGIPCRILEVRKIVEARFTYDVQVYFPVLANRIRELFRNLPAGVRVAPERDFEEQIDDREGGVGMYAPIHRYHFRGNGLIHGAPFGVVLFWRSCLDEPAIEVRSARVVEIGRTR